MALVDELDRDSVEYALVGGLAVAVWGAPRATKDIRALPMTFRDGMRLQRVSRAEPGKAGTPSEIMTLDLILADEPLLSAWTSRQRLTAGGRGLSVVSRDALIAMKAAAARPLDVADIEKLREIDR
ncbi:MAG: hypothetical protein KIT84_23885 [Labilithrix sp.]|nr:hypothetical protein [Labilithrix sp.]